MLRPVALVLPVLLSGVPTLGLLVSDAPVAGRVLLATVLGLSCFRPADALLVVAGLLPFGGVLGVLAKTPFSLTEPMALAFLAGWLGREMVWPGPGLRVPVRRLLLPAALMAIVVSASAAVELAVLQPFRAYPAAFARECLAFFASRFYLDRLDYPPLTDGVPLLSGLGLFTAAVVLSARHPRLPLGLVRMTVAGATGVALLNLNRLAALVLRAEDSWKALQYHLSSTRISSAFADPNAAGSYFVMAAFFAAGLALTPGRGRRVGWISLGCIVFGLWLTGSRVALAAAPLTALIGFLLWPRLWPRHHFRWRMTLAVLFVVSAPVLMFLVGRAPQRAPVGTAAESRWALAQAGARMATEHPVFGVGVGRFKPLSGAYLDMEYRRTIGDENAHNNFLQILAELGLAGFLPFTWLLVGAGRHFDVARASPLGPIATAVAAGIAAFLMTCLGGHPLLIQEVAQAFWLGLGAMAGLPACAAGAVLPVDEGEDRAGGEGRSGRRYRWLFACVSAAILLSVPVRVSSALAERDFSDAAIGFSRWERDRTGSDARRMIGGRAQFFVPGNAKGVRLSLLLDSVEPAKTSTLSIFIEGQLTSRLRLDSGKRLEVPLTMRPGGRSAFRRVELIRDDQPVNDGVVWVGQPLVGGKRRATPGDFNRDGLADIVWRRSSGHNVVWLMKDGGFLRQEALPGELNARWRIVAVADMNGDESPDLVWRNDTNGENAVWYLQGFTFVSQALLPPEPDVGWEIGAVEGPASDGVSLLFWRNRQNGRNVVWQLRGTTLLSTEELPAVPGAAWRIAAAADFDSDGRQDLVWSHAETGQNRVWYLNGSTLRFQADLPVSKDPAWLVVAAGDYTGDGVPDLVLRHGVTGEVVLWYLDGVKLRRQIRLPAVADRNWSPAGNAR